MLKKSIFWFLGIVVACAIIAYTLLFSAFGNALLKPLLQAKIDSLAPIKLEITQFSLKPDALYLELQNGAYIDIVLDGHFWIPSQEFTLTLNALVHDISIFGELVDTPLQGAFRLEAQSSGTFDDFNIVAKSDIAKSFSTLHIYLRNQQLQSLEVYMQEASIQELLAMLGHKPYINGVLSIDTKLIHKDSAFEGATNAVVRNGVFNTEALQKDFGIALEDNSFSARLDTQTQDKSITHTFEFLAPIGNIHAQGVATLPDTLSFATLRTMPIDTSFRFGFSNLTPFSPIFARAIRGSLQGSGTITGALLEALEIQGHSDFANSNTHYKLMFKDLLPLSFEAHTQNMALKELLWMLYLPPYTSAILDADLFMTNLHTTPTTKIVAKANGMLNPDTKIMPLTLPRTPLTLHISMNLNGSNGDGALSLVGDSLQLEANPLKIQDFTFFSPYTLHIQDLTKLAFSSGITLRGGLDFSGNMTFDKLIAFDFLTQSLGGMITGNYRDSQINAQLHDIASQKILALFGIAPVVQAELSGNFSYNTLAQRGVLSLSGKDGKMSTNALSNDVVRFLGVDMTKEIYQNVALDTKFDDATLHANFALDSQNTHLQSQKTHINLQTRTIDSLLTLRIGKNEANVWLTQNLQKPNVRVELKNLVLDSAELLQGLGNFLHKKK